MTITVIVVNFETISAIIVERTFRATAFVVIRVGIFKKDIEGDFPLDFSDNRL
ncbi:MAG: hypothetical protein WBG50_10115 [Desulfomonilaceae bacterium]